MMRAQVGDWLVTKGRTVDLPEERGLITEVRSGDGSPPYVVQWSTGTTATVFPGSDAIVVTAAELKAKEATARGRG